MLTRALQWMSWPEWAALAQQPVRCDLRPFVAESVQGSRVRITPSLGWHANLSVLCGDWIPVHADGRAVIDQMVHTPDLRLPRARNVQMAPRDAAGVPQGPDQARYERELEVGGELVLAGGAPNYYHWLIDYLPRVMLAVKFARLGGARLLVNQDLARFQSESLTRLGFGDASLVRAGPMDAVRCPRVLVSGLLASTSVCHPQVPQWLRDRFKPLAPGAWPRVYLSRHDAPTRTLTNEDDATRLLERWGYRRVVPGTLGFQQQVDLAAGARHLVALHGAGLTNMVFCAPGATVLEIHSDEFRPTFMRTLARQCGHTHLDSPARVVTRGADGNPQSGTWEADLDALQARLSQLHPDG